LGLERFCGSYFVPDQLGISEALANDLANKVAESVAVFHRQAIVKPKRPFIQERNK